MRFAMAILAGSAGVLVGSLLAVATPGCRSRCEPVGPSPADGTFVVVDAFDSSVVGDTVTIVADGEASSYLNITTPEGLLVASYYWWDYI